MELTTAEKQLLADMCHERMVGVQNRQKRLDPRIGQEEIIPISHMLIDEAQAIESIRRKLKIN